MMRLRSLLCGLLLCTGAACDGQLQGLEAAAAPLLALRVRATGDLAAVRPVADAALPLRLRVGVVWGDVHQPDNFCIRNSPWAALAGQAPLAQDPSAVAVAAAGCRDILSFTPADVGPSVPIALGQTTQIDFYDLPLANLLVGPPEGRVGYATVVVYDDRDGNGSLDLPRPASPSVGGQGGGPQGGSSGGGGKGGGKERLQDAVYAASWVTMAQPHQRLAYREGGFDKLQLFYPMIGCEPPPPGFSVVSVQGLPTAAQCSSQRLGETVVELAVQPTAAVLEAVCSQRNNRWRAPRDKEDLSQPWVCLNGNELVIADPPGGCKGISKWSLRGCRQDPDCDVPEWDVRAFPPAWWPCGDATRVKR
jgi:hypothetical protein